MGAKDIQEAVARLQHLARLADAYGHLLTAAELDRALPGLVPILTTGEVSAAQAGGLLKEILQRGPAGLLAEMEELERIGRAVKEPQVYAALNRARDMFLHVARYNAAALLRRLEQRAQTGPAASLHKEVQAFMQGVARVAPVSGTELDEIFADEELPGTDPPPANRGNGSEGPTITAPAIDDPVRDDRHRLVEAANESIAAPWDLDQEESEPNELPEPTELSAPTESAAPTESPAAREMPTPAAPIDWMRERVEVFNDMLQRWAAGEGLRPEASALVRRGRLTVDRCGELYRELLEGGAVAVLERLAGLNEDNGEAADQARALRSLIVDGAVASVPRLLRILTTGGQLKTEVYGAREEQGRILPDLVDYLSGAAELFEAGSPLRDRLLYLSAELRTAISS